MTFRTVYQNWIIYVQNLNELRRHKNLPQHQKLKHEKKLIEYYSSHQIHI